MRPSGRNWHRAEVREKKEGEPVAFACCLPVPPAQAAWSVDFALRHMAVQKRPWLEKFTTCCHLALLEVQLNTGVAK